MTTSEHFDLNLIEGSDIVNPLVIDKPNYEKIDAQMFENQSASIGTATELTTGSIHAITRELGNTNMFRFTATSNYTLGDTFTVDGVSVTALLPNGTALPDHAYVVGGTVLCSLVGTLLTVYTIGIAEADDARKLGGELPSFYAKDSELQSVSVLAQGAATLAQNNQSDIAQLNSDLTDSKKNNFGNSVNIKSYNTTANKYECPNDGYIFLNCTNSTNDYVMVTLYGNSDNESNWVQIRARYNHNYTNSIYVRKGVKALVQTIDGSPEILFVPFV